MPKEHVAITVRQARELARLMKSAASFYETAKASDLQDYDFDGEVELMVESIRNIEKGYAA